MGKGGQITIFIILAIAALMGTAIVLFLGSIRGGIGEFAPVSIEELPTELAPIQIYVDSCVEKSLKDALKRLGAHGGYIGTLPEYEKYTGRQFNLDYAGINPTNFEAVKMIPNDPESQIPYWYYMESKNDCDQKGGPCITKFAYPEFYMNNTYAGEPKSIEEQLNLYVADRIAECTSDFSIFEAQGINIIKQTEPVVNVVIGEDYTSAYVDMELDINSELTGKANLDRFFGRAKVSLPRIVMLARLLSGMENNNNIIERIALEVINIHSGLNTDIPPFSASEMSTRAKTWRANTVRPRLKELFSIYFEGLDATNTYGYEPQTEFPNTYEEAFYNGFQLVPLEPGFNDLSVDFAYFDWIKIYLLLNGGQEVGPKKELGFPLFPIPQFIDYQTNYDVSVPLIVTITDPDSDVTKEGDFSFTFALEGNIRNNKPIDTSAIMPQIGQTDVTPFGVPQHCDENQRTGGQVTIFVTDVDDNLIEDAFISIQSGLVTCNMGETYIPENDYVSLYAEKFPVGFEILKVSKEGYLDEYIPIIVDDKPQVINMKLRPMTEVIVSGKKYHMKKVPPSPPPKSGGGFSLGLLDVINKGYEDIGDVAKTYSVANYAPGVIAAELAVDYLEGEQPAPRPATPEELLVALENLTDAEVKEVMENQWYFNVIAPTPLRDSENATDKITVVMTRHKDNEFSKEYVTAFELTGNKTENVLIPEGTYDIQVFTRSKIPSFHVPKERRCKKDWKQQRKCTTVYEGGDFGGEEEYYAGNYQINNTYIQKLDDGTSMYIYAMYHDWEAVPENWRYINDLSILNKFNDYASEYRDYLKPKIYIGPSTLTPVIQEEGVTS